MTINQNDLIERIRALDGLSDDERSALLGLLRSKKTYGLVWEDKPEDVEQRLRDELPVLLEVPHRAIKSHNPDAPNHILIEGDNLEALTALSYTHEGRVDVIYIDPPYNTGNKDFVYNDSFVDREDGYRHSKWLSFMAKRLRIAKRLLSDRGVIFISIDDNEQAQLKLLCDEIFGQSNYLNHFVWLVNLTGRQISGTGAAKTWESILCYGKKTDLLKPFSIDISFAKSVMPDAYKGFNKDIRKDSIGEFAIGDTLYNHNRKFNEETRPNLVFSIFYNPTTEEILPDDIGATHHGYVEILPHANADGKHLYHAWRWSRKKIMEESYNLIVLPKSKGQYEVYTRIREFSGTTLKDIITNISNGDSELLEILGEKKFDYPKSTNLLRTILGANSSKECLILDFFAGSGTTLHATMALNAEDGGKRQCILVTNNENGICENVTYERNKRVIEGYTTPKGQKVEGLTDNSLRYFRTAFVGRRRTPQNMRRLMMLATDMLCIKEDIYTEHDEFCGQPTLANGYRYFADRGRQMLIVYSEEAIYPLVELISGIKVDEPITVYVFSPANDPWTSEWEDVADKVRPTALPAAIYNAYKRVLPKPKETLIDKGIDASTEEGLGGLFEQ